MTPISMAVLWAIQSTVLGVAGLLAARLLRGAPAIARLRWYQVVLVAALVLPWALPGLVPDSATVLRTSAGGGTDTSSMVGSAGDASGRGALSGLQAWDVASVAAGLWLSGVVARLLWLALGLARLRTLGSRSRTLHDPVLDEARMRTGAEAVCRVSARIDQPMTWGLQMPTMLVPRRLRHLPPSQREAIYVHELLHVARGDTRMVWLEELLRAVLWFHPAVWLVVARLRLAREEVVDQATVALTLARRPYLEALLWCADESRSRTRPLVPVVPFFTRHQLLTRVASLTTEGTMSKVRTALTASLLAVMFTAGSMTLASLAPMPVSPASRAEALGQAPDSGLRPGPLEQAAVRPTLDDPAPRRIFVTDPEWPADAQAAGASGHFMLHVVIAADGTVGEARVIGSGLRFRSSVAGIESGDDLVALGLSLQRAALAAVHQWTFEPPSVAPMLLTAEVAVGDPPAASVGNAEWQSHLERAQRSLDLLAGETAAVRVGADVKAPRRIVNVQPVYPPIAQQANVQGVVIVEAIVEPSGDVSTVRVLRSIPLLDAAALDAVRQWKYEPSARRVVVTTTVHFAL